MTPIPSLAALAAHFAGMPPVAAMQPAIIAWDAGVLRLRAPLAANINDKNCAFGGSLSSLMTIAGWGIVSLTLAEAGLDADVYVADSRVRYLKPVFEDLVVDAAFDDPLEAAGLADTLRHQGRASVRIQARTQLADGSAGATLVARYVAIIRD